MKLLDESQNLGDIATVAVVVETIADDEIVGNLDGDVVGFEIDLAVLGFEEHCCNADIGCALILALLDEALDGDARVDNILDDDDRSACEILIKSDELLDDARGLRPLIGSELDERDLGGDVDQLHEVGGEHECAIEDAQEERVATFEVVIDGLRHFGDGIFDLRLGV